MIRSLVLTAAPAVLIAALAVPARANAPVLVLKNGTIVNLDTQIEVRPGRSPVRLSRVAIARLIAAHEAALARQRIEQALKKHPHFPSPRAGR